MRRKGTTLVVVAIALALPILVQAEQKADLVVVKKSESRLFLERDGKAFASFQVAFGANPKGHKQRQGDERTPEGRYVLDSKNAASSFYKAIHISYPNAADKVAAKARGIDPGGLVMIHGQKNGFGWFAPITQHFNWTDGCIGLRNRDIDKVWESVDVGTPIEIHP